MANKIRGKNMVANGVKGNLYTGILKLAYLKVSNLF